MIFVCLLALVIVLVLCYFIAKWFYAVAEEKGYHDNKYFWICFWVSIVGMLLVIALPDRAEKISNAPSDANVPGFISGAMDIPKRKHSEGGQQ